MFFRDILNVWLAQLEKKSFDFLSFFSTDREQLQWQSEGLPNDRVSLENAVIIKKVTSKLYLSKKKCFLVLCGLLFSKFKI